MEIPEVRGGYRTILIDPPWPYKQKLVGKARGGAEKYYETMSLKDIEALPIFQLGAEHCQLWLWTTVSHTHEAFHILEAWRFRYVSQRVWVKGRVEGSKLVSHFGLGYWIRGQHEILLLAVKGNPRSKLKGPKGATGLNIASVILAPRAKHSEKPEQSYQDIERMSEEPRLELFARKGREGWNGWGDELKGWIQRRLV